MKTVPHLQMDKLILERLPFFSMLGRTFSSILTNLILKILGFNSKRKGCQPTLLDGQMAAMGNKLFIYTVFFLVQYFQVHSQQPREDIHLDSRPSFEITSGESHRFTVAMSKNEFVGFKLVQHGADLKITTYDANGEPLKMFDHLSNSHGTEFFYMVSQDGGMYNFDVVTVGKTATNGKYELDLFLREPRATTLTGQVDQLFALWDSHTDPGFAIAVLQDGNLVYRKGFGLANLEYGIPNGSKTVFHVASLSKQFTVFAILLLESWGLLSLDDDIREYIPELANFGKPITLRHLASHTSGLRDQWNLLALAGWRMDDVITMDHILKLVFAQQELNFMPGEEFLYSNTGYTLLAEVVSRLTDQSFAEFTATNIFNPLGMKDTQFFDDHEKIVPNRSYSYHHRKGHPKKSTLNFANVGATGLFTTVEDLSLWALNFSNTKLGSPELIKKMDTPALLNDGKEFGGALGQFVGKYKGLNEIRHAGADAGYRSYLGRFPDEGLSVIVLANYAEFKPEWAAHEITDIYLWEKIDEYRPVREKISEKDKSKKTIRHIGQFERSSKRFIGILGQRDIPTRQSTENLGKKQHIAFENRNLDKDKMNGKDYKEVSGVSLEEYTGSFYSEELSTTYHISLKDGMLVASHQRIPDFELYPGDKDSFSTNVWFIGTIEFERDSLGQVVGCKISSSRVRNLRFTKL